MKKYLFPLLALLAIVSTSQAQTANETRLLRFPAVYENQVVFSYAGDLYTVGRTGGVARKLTNHVGYEMFPRFSNDGTQLAFTGQYDGNTEVYTMSAQGGPVKRITYTATLGRDDIGDRMGPNNIVMTWSRDDQNVIYRSRRYSFNSFKGQLFSAPVSGDLSTMLPFESGGWCTYSEDGKKMAYNRVFREFRTWKYYEGGMADDVWIYDTETEATENITNNKAQDIFPMYYKNKVYFFSDRDRRMNLFVYDTETKKTEKLTTFEEFDCKFPSLGKDAIAFENGGYIYIYDLKTNQQQKVNIRIAEDFASGRTKMIDASKFIGGAGLSPDGSRVAVSGRGEVFSVPAKAGVTRNLTNSSGHHDRNPVWSPDGEWIAYVSDKTGEDELYVQKQDGTEPARQLTKDNTNYMYSAKWSPDGKKLLYSDREQHIYIVDVASGKKTSMVHSNQWELRDFSISPDNKWVCYTQTSVQGNASIALYNMESKKIVQVTDPWYDSNSPVFSDDGKFLYFVSARDFNPTYSATEWNHSYSDMNKIYMVALSPDTESPFALENDEVEVDSDDDDEATTDATVDFDDIANRVESLPIKAGSYWQLQAVKGGLYYSAWRSGADKSQLKYFNFEDKKETVIGSFRGFSISANGKKILVRKGRDLYIENLPKGKLDAKNKVDLSGMKVMVDFSEEWKQIYYESWRQFRDFFYDPGMQGVDWPAMRDKYAQLLPHVNHRNDLIYIIGELIGELNIGHAYVGGGDRPKPDRIKMGLLGARFSRDKSGFYKIDHILDGENWTAKLASPLKANGLNINPGDYIIAINGKSVKDMDNMFQGLIGQAGKTIELTVNTSGSEKGARTVLVKPIADESELYYYEWVEGNLAKVNELSDGQIGYIHIPDMVANGLNQFARYFYPQLEKKAVIIDARGNGGGNVSPMIIERLRREMSMVRQVRNSDAPRTKPAQFINGPKVCLLNQYSASDGDLFPYQFRFHGIGKLIGVRSWGGVVGIRGSRPFIDGGYVRVPEFSHYAADGSKWVIEGEGVSPDIEVENDPHAVYEGTDAQLQKAVEHLLEEIKLKWKAIPSAPAFPDKTH